MAIAIVFGGKSYEHDVSVVTAKQIYSVAKLKHEVKLLYLDRQNRLFEYTNSKFNFSDFKGDNKFLQRIILQDGEMKCCGFGFKRKVKIDAAIICCHGGVGENGDLEAYFKLCGIPVSAGGSFGLCVAMDKWKTKQILKNLKINVIDGILIESKMNPDEIVSAVEQKLSYPVIVKPNSGGSSIGIKVAKSREEFLQAIKVGFEFDTKCVVEKALTDFDEYNQAVLGDQCKFEISKIDKVSHKSDMLTFNEKYLSNSKQKGKGMKSQKRTFDCELSKKNQDKINCWSEKIFKELGFFGVIRIDYIFDKNAQKFYVNEINAVPGSLAIYFFSFLGGIGFVDRLIDIAKQNYAKDDKINQKFVTNLF
ncbi:MAG: ATP-grasp domain-containing protein [Clostridia bacterium]|nr:ATP-grasp domain-containing protein [Clostridia bacterium]